MYAEEDNGEEIRTPMDVSRKYGWWPFLTRKKLIINMFYDTTVSSSEFTCSFMLNMEHPGYSSYPVLVLQIQIIWPGMIT